MPKIVILRGRPASGKSTAFAKLKKRKEFDGWVLIDNCELKSWFNYLEENKEIKKKALFALMKEVMKKKKNILLEEMSRKTIMKYIGNYVKKYKYKFVVFQFYVDTQKAKRRDKKRVKDPKHPHCQLVNIEEWHKYHDKNLDPRGIIVDCDKLNKKQVVDFILENLK